MSRVDRLRTTDRIFFVTVNLRRSVPAFETREYRMMIEVLEGSRRRLGFLLCGYVRMPDHWHALIWTGRPLTISQVVHDVKKVAARRRQRKARRSLDTALEYDTPPEHVHAPPRA